MCTLLNECSFLNVFAISIHSKAHAFKRVYWSLHIFFTLMLKTFSFVVGAIARRYAFYGRGIGPILRDRVACTGQETRLRDCWYNTPASYYLSHFYDAGVRCIIIGRFNKN